MFVKSRIKETIKVLSKICNAAMLNIIIAEYKEKNVNFMQPGLR